MYLNNKYTRWYFNVIRNTKANCAEYTEKHHIMPKSLDGSNCLTNIVRLTAREHFICHLLLPKMTQGTDKAKMVFALQQFLRNNPYHKRPTINSRTYEYAKKLFSIEMSKLHTDKKVSSETIAKQRTTRLKNNKKRTDEMRAAWSRITKQRWETDRQRLLSSFRTEEFRRKASKSAKARGLSQGTIDSLKGIHARMKGKGNPTARKIRVTSPVGEQWVIHGAFRQFCKEHNLPFSSMCWLLKGRTFDSGKCVGWSAEYVDKS